MLQQHTVNLLNAIFSLGEYQKYNCSKEVSIKMGSYTLEPILTEERLRQEDFQMENCCYDDLEQLKKGKVQLISIRAPDSQTVATVWFITVEDKWYYSKCLGKFGNNLIAPHSIEVDGACVLISVKTDEVDLVYDYDETIEDISWIILDIDDITLELLAELAQNFK
ncbi:hypothetical protein [Desulfovibrio sp. JC022]|uniref:hypothetical protein n=1 Tax=Desulfovibrio sp. JC022 TaxID=2593642 RepID=UPI0010AB1C9C|nr:hypothetical protein [Desulfovibrio sp. JC022]NDV24438.1 hypothetical protein [Desulfovibrio sp. JC022]TIH12076.1 hypothetical protein D0S45_19245 [Marinifilum sp. JC120]